MRILFWRTYYFFADPFRHLYWRTVRPKTRGVKCVIENDGKFLLVQLAYAHKMWTFPGGAVDPAESFEEAAYRELKEETGVMPHALAFFAQYGSDRGGKRDTVQCFFGTTGRVQLSIDPLEIAKAGWFALSELPAARSDRVDSIIKLLDQWKTAK